MTKSEQLIDNFYKSFAKKDYKTMQTCYHPEAQFTDPVFLNLQGSEINAMWHMHCEAGRDLQISFGTIASYDNKVTVQWKAGYTFYATGNYVQNHIQAEFFLKDGLILIHNDMFDLWRWSRMALGTKGLLFGWSSFVQTKIQSQAQKSLNRFILQHPEYKHEN